VDCVSRGLFPSQAVSMALYWNGPEFLQSNENMWPADTYVKLSSSSLPEVQNINADISVLTILSTFTEDWISRFSSVVRLQRTVSYIRRFVRNLKKLPPLLEPITSDESADSLTCVICSIQIAYFSSLFCNLQSKNIPIVPRSIAQLAPFTVNEGIIRVGGQLQNAEMNVNHQCPVLLPKKSTLTHMLIRHLYFTYFPVGPQLVSSLIAQRYWILSSRFSIRHVIFKCVVCT